MRDNLGILELIWARLVAATGVHFAIGFIQLRFQTVGIATVGDANFLGKQAPGFGVIHSRTALERCKQRRGRAVD